MSSKPIWTPKADMLHGRILDVNKTRGGLALPDSDFKNTTMLMLVDAIGPDVTRCKAGEVIVYRACNHIWLRDGTHVAMVKNEDVWATVEGLDPVTYSLEGDEPLEGRGAQVLRA